MIPVARSLVPRLALAAGILIAAGSASRSASAWDRSLNYLTTGNGFGFQIYDASQNKITRFLEHPYRYVAAQPGQPFSEGVFRRNLAFDVYFGVRSQSGSGWLNGGSATTPEYTDQTNIIHAAISLGGMNTDSYFFAPFGYQGNAMIAVINGGSASDAYINLNFHLGSGVDPDQSQANGETISTATGTTDAVTETGPGGGAMVYVALTGLTAAQCNVPNAPGVDLTGPASCSGNDQTVAMQKKLDDGWWAVGIQFVENAADAETAAANLKTWAGGRGGQKILTDAQAEFEAWRKPPPAAISFTGNEQPLWRQSEAVLRMGQVMEPYSATRKNHGMMLASLPMGEWHTGWVRDGMYAIVALARTGHNDESRAAMDFLLNAAPVGQGKYAQWLSIPNYRISICRYLGTGEEEGDFSGQTTPNIEVDGWGMAMWAARQYVDSSGDVAWLNSMTTLDPSKSVYQTIVDGIATPLESDLEVNGVVKADSGIWEVHQGSARHFAYTTLAAARGFCDMAALAKRVGNASDVTKYQDLSKKVISGFAKSFKDQNSAFVGSMEQGHSTTRADASVVEVFTWNLVKDFSQPYVQPTFNLLNTLQVASGGFKRNDENQGPYDNNEWILIDLRMSDAFRRAGNTDKANSLLGTVVDKAAVNFNLVPELYCATNSCAAGTYTGSIPMVGYGAAAYMLTLFDRATLIEPNDCGTEEPPVNDSGTGGAGGTGSGGGPGNGGSGATAGSGASANGGTGGCDDPMSCNQTPSAADNANIPMKSACACRLDGASTTSGEWFSLSLLPLALIGRYLSRRRRA